MRSCVAQLAYSGIIFTSPLIWSSVLQAFIIATLLRVAQGSATVALTTTAGLLSAAVAAANLANVQLVALVMA